jgi:hypothetical protein
MLLTSTPLHGTGMQAICTILVSFRENDSSRVTMVKWGVTFSSDTGKYSKLLTLPL